MPRSFFSHLRLAPFIVAVPLLSACSGDGTSVPAPSPRHEVAAMVPSALDAAPPDATGPCTGDADCASNDLCVAGTCRRACHRDDACSAGATCHTETGGGWCYNAPGCNPPPPGIMCPTLCYGYCE